MEERGKWIHTCGVQAERREYKNRTDRLAKMKSDLTILGSECDDAKSHFDHAMDRFRDKELAKEVTSHIHISALSPSCMAGHRLERTGFGPRRMRPSKCGMRRKANTNASRPK
jgi:hypothetical protein